MQPWRRSRAVQDVLVLLLGATRALHAAAATPGTNAFPVAETASQQPLVTDAPSRLELEKRYFLQDGDALVFGGGEFVGWFYNGQKCRLLPASPRSFQSRRR
jgi:hypothetical protein